jgi:hypothetical protein
MALAADQQAMLQLLLERGQSYADLGSVLGMDEAGVRSRAREALTELAGVDPDRNVGLTDYLLGQADPIGRADAVRHLKDHPADLELATELSQKLRLVAPQADLPRLPGEERRPRPRRTSGGPTSRLPIPRRLRGGRGAGDPAGAPATAGAGTALTRRQTRLIVVLGCAAVLVVVAVLAVTGTFKGGDSTAATTTTSATTQPGQAEGFPLTPLKVSGSGSVNTQVPIPATLRNLIPRVQAIYVTQSNSRALALAVNKAVQSKQLILPVSGSPQLVGAVGSPQGNTIPIELKAVKGAQGTGSVSIDVSSPKNPVLDVKLAKLEAPPKNQVDIVWFVFGLSQ